MTDDIQKLSKVLDELVQLLETAGEKHWSNWMSDAKANLGNSTDYGIEHILAAYGGMGSFNDLIVHRKTESGRLKWSLSDRLRNKKLNKLRKQAWGLADSIRRDRMSSDS